MNACIDNKAESQWRETEDNMRTQEPPSSGSEETFSLPINLTEWVDASKLLDWVEEDVEQFDWQNPELVDYLKRNSGYRPKGMLCLLTYAYATQILSADEIVNRCYSDTVFRLICENKAPTVAEVRRFRRENRSLLKGMLLPLFIRVVKAKFDLGDILLPAGLKRYLMDNAVERLDTARHMDSNND